MVKATPAAPSSWVVFAATMVWAAPRSRSTVVSLLKGSRNFCRKASRGRFAAAFQAITAFCSLPRETASKLAAERVRSDRGRCPMTEWAV